MSENKCIYVRLCMSDHVFSKEGLRRDVLLLHAESADATRLHTLDHVFMTPLLQRHKLFFPIF